MTESIVPSLRQIVRGRLPGQVIVQMTNRCNARCPQCGMRATNRFDRSDLANDDVKRLIDAAAAQGVQAISFTGGEPFLRLNHLVALIKHAGQAGIPYIRTGTNGFMFIRHEAPDFSDRIKRLADILAATPLRNLWISIDSADPETHERMRGLPDVIAGIRKALPEFHARGIYPAANLGLNRNLGGAPLPHMGEAEASHGLFSAHLRDGLRRFYNHVIDLGFTMVNTCYPMSDDTVVSGDGLSAVYAATSSDDIVRFTRWERAVLFTTLSEIIPEFRGRIRVFSPLTSLRALSRFYADGQKTAHGCRGGLDFFFIDAVTGDTYPCGYRGHENLGKFWNLDTKTLPREADCDACDWECFRDPSELFGPFRSLFVQPLKTLGRLASDREMTRLWIEDLRYHRACGFFDGRRPADYARMARFYRPSAGETWAGSGYPPTGMNRIPETSAAVRGRPILAKR